MTVPSKMARMTTHMITMIIILLLVNATGGLVVLFGLLQVDERFPYVILGVRYMFGDGVHFLAL